MKNKKGNTKNSPGITPAGRKKILAEYNKCYADFKEPLDPRTGYSMGRQLIGQIIGEYTHGLILTTHTKQRTRVPFSHIQGIWPKYYPKNTRNKIPFTDIAIAANNGGKFPKPIKIRKKTGGIKKEKKRKEK